MTAPLVLPKIAGTCIDCGRHTNLIQQGDWQGFCPDCAADAIVELRRLEHQ